MGKRKVIKKSKTDVVVKEEENVLPSKRNSDEAVPKKVSFKIKTTEYV